MDDNTEKLSIKDRTRNCFKFHWRGMVLIIIPLIFLPLLFLTPTKPMRCAYLLCVMAIFWILEVIPIYITALIPIVALPIMGIMSSMETCGQYMKDVVMFFIVSMIIALAVEYSNFHTRLALNVISLVGCSPRRLHFSLMAVTTFISFWIANSATTAMMCPIVKAILIQLDEQGLIKFNSDRQPNNEEDPPYPSKITISFFLGIAYAASIGGVATLIGTGTNLALKGLYDERFPEGGEITFNMFLFFNVPPVLIVLVLTYFWLEIIFMGLFRPKSKAAQELFIGPEGTKAAKEIIKQKLKDLGPMSAFESFVAFYFLLMVLLLIVRSPDVFPGYADIMNEKSIKNSPATIFVVFLLFATPASWFFCKYFGCRRPENDKPAEPIMSWNYVQTEMSWNIPILLGGGFALSKGISESRLAVFIGHHLQIIENLPHPIVQLITIFSALIFTAFSSNVAMCNILIPILFEIALAIEVHPLYLALPAGIAISLAFHFPVSTPPNAIAAGIVNIRTMSMAVGGIGPSIISLLVYFLFSQTWAYVIFPDIGKFPAWGQDQKSTIV